MKLPSEVIPKFIISLDKNKERQEYLQKEVYPKLTNYFKCAAFDAELDDANEILKDNKIFITNTFYDKCSEGQLGCFLSHFQLWKYIIKSNLDLAIILEDDVKIYSNFNKTIDTIYENLPVKFDYVHLFIHPDKQNIQYLEGKDGDIIPAEDNFGTVAYIISLRGAKRLVKLVELLKIQAPVDRQINFCIQHNFIKAFMIKKPFLLTKGEIMPNRAIYENSFKSTIWYSKKLKDTKKINEEFIKIAGFTDEDIERIDRELLMSKQKNEEFRVAEDDSIIIKKIIEKEPSDYQSDPQPKITSEKKSEINLEIESKVSEEEQIVNAIITKLHEMDHA
jgi:GR25 family glycosyltransferase involved in LPS biosynthesis